MPSIDKIFTGKLNLDDSISLLEKYDYIDGLNITKDAVDGSQDMAVTNIIANRSVSYSLPAGTNQVIGAKGDPLRNRMYYFVWNSNLRHSILQYNNTTRVVTKLLENITDTGGDDVLAFARFKKIIHVDIIHRDEGDLVYWVEADTGRPRKINVSTIQSFVPVTEDIINAAKDAPSLDLTGNYQDDDNVNVNNLRKKLFQFAQSWVYQDGEESTLSPLSKVPLPVNGYDPDTVNDPTNNNNISIAIIGGGEDYQKIKLYGRESIGTTWSDYFLIETFDRDEYNINPGASFIYLFYNDSVYPFQDVNRTTLLFDWLPDKANAQALANGNVLVYGGITEGYDNLTRDEIEVEMASGVGAPNTPTISFGFAGSGIITIVIGNTLVVGTTYHVEFTYVSNAPGDVSPKNVNYVSILGDTSTSIAVAIGALLNGNNISATSLGAGYLRVQTINGINGTISDVLVNVSTSGAENAAAAWNWYSKYRFGLIYFNDLMKPLTIVSFVGSSVDTNDFAVTTPDFTVAAGIIQVPFISAAINHLPPAGATTYQWLRTTNLTTSKFLYWITNDYQLDTEYLYFCIENLDYTITKNTGFVPSYEFAKGDHIRVIAKYAAGVITTYNLQLDFEIIGEEERIMTSPASLGRFIKVDRPPTLPSLAYSANIIIELYTPSLKTSEGAQVFYEWGERYEVYEFSPGVFYHAGQINNQTPTQPATFKWFDGDVYFKSRESYLNVNATTTIDEFTIDANYNDYFSSAVNSNGRAWPLDPDAKVQYFPTLMRFGQAYQPDTNINGLNRFYPDNFYDRCNRSYGDILKLSVKGSYLHVGQKFKIGNVPVLLQIVKDSNSQDILATSDQLLNQIVYYQGDYGVGDTPESWVDYNFASYFTYSTRGIICRLSLDGITPISILYKVNSFATDQLPARTGNYKVYGAYDPKSNNYIIALEATNLEAAYTLSFDEETNQFESFLSYLPEMMCTLGDLLITFKDGGMWTHDDPIVFNSFYGAIFDSYITAPFNDGIRTKKTFTVISEIASGIWDCPLIYTNVQSYAGQRQETSLGDFDFTVFEQNPSAAILRDVHSINGNINGDAIKGNFIVVRFRKSNAQTLVALNEATVNYIDSPLTSK